MKINCGNPHKTLMHQKVQYHQRARISHTVTAQHSPTHSSYYPGLEGAWRGPTPISEIQTVKSFRHHFNSAQSVHHRHHPCWPAGWLGYSAAVCLSYDEVAPTRKEESHIVFPLLFHTNGVITVYVMNMTAMEMMAKTPSKAWRQAVLECRGGYVQGGAL